MSIATMAMNITKLQNNAPNKGAADSYAPQAGENGIEKLIAGHERPFIDATPTAGAVIYPTSARGSIHLGWPLAAWRQSRPNWLEG